MDSKIKKYVTQYNSIEKLIGKSGNDVFLIKNDDVPICVMKVFKNELDLFNEINSYNLLLKHNFKTVKVLHYDVTDLSLFLSVASGQLVANYIMQNTDDTEKLYNVGYIIGLTLKKLHQTNTGKRNAGNKTYVHGDPSPRNFFINDTNEIIIIDAKNLRDEFLGFPACDYHRFIFSLRCFAKTEKLYNSDHIIKHIIDGFINGYGQKIFSEQSDLRYDKHWQRIYDKLKQ